MTDPRRGASYYAGTPRPQYRIVGGPDFRPLDGVTTATAVLLGIAGLASLVGVYPFLNRVFTIHAYLDGTATLAALADADDAVVALLTVNFLVTVATGALFMVWQYRLAVNAELLRREPMSLGPGWAIGGWFIPFANFVLPYLQLRQSARATDPNLQRPQDVPVSGRVPRIVTAWTVLFVASTVLMAIGIGMRGRPEDARTSADPARESGLAFAQGDEVAALSMAVSVAAAIVAVIMVRSVTARQNKAIQLMLSPM
jgi:uncharacterized protein DUF4328